MKEPASSKTALGVAVLRAVHQLLDDLPKILDDPVVLRLLDTVILNQIRSNPSRFQITGSLKLRSHILLRSRYAEEQLEKAYRQGVRQYVILGAGLDTFAYRQPEWARDLKIFEVDQPASQQEKRLRLAQAGIEIPKNVELVSVDFETTTLAERLRTSSFDFNQGTFISWLGVMVYLSREAAEAIFQFVAKLPVSSELVFTFSPPVSASSQTGNTLAERVASLGEPWQTFITPKELEEYLQDLNFSEIIFPTPTELEKLYFEGRKDGLYSPLRQTIARLVV